MHRSSGILFRQLQDNTSKTFTYILGCKTTNEAIIIDPVDTCVDRDSQLINRLNLKLVYALNTHCHADHITGTKLLKEKFPGCKSVISKASGARADWHLVHDDKIKFGDSEIIAKATPGHTSGCMSYIAHSLASVFTGDAVFVQKCGRTDFQEGNSRTLYQSVHREIFSLPTDYAIYPGHDYAGFTQSTVAEEKQFNLRLSKTEDEFVEIMDNLGLSYPKMIDVAVPANLKCGYDD